MMINMINNAFESVSKVNDGVTLLEAFQFLAKRKEILRCVDKKTAEVYTLFIKQVESIRFDCEHHRKAPPLRHQEPQYSGAALWARSLAQVVERDWELLQNAHYLKPGSERDDAEAAYNGLLLVVDEKQNKTLKQLKVPLPRCGHEHKVSCAKHVEFEQWRGVSCEEIDVVEEGVSYGPKDYRCRAPVTFKCRPPMAAIFRAKKHFCGRLVQLLHVSRK